MTDQAREVQCRNSVPAWDENGDATTQRCPWRGPLNDFAEHTEDTGHKACRVCSYPLAHDELGACRRCLDQVRDHLKDITDAYATLPSIVEHSGYRMRGLPGGNALAMLADGSVDSLRPYNPPPVIAHPVQLEHAPMAGHDIDHPGYTEIRLPSDGREHFHDHWQTDPASVVAVLDAIERNWRQQLGHGPADDIATVSRSTNYLHHELAAAAVAVDDFPDAVTEIAELRNRLVRTAGLSDDPDPAPADCFDCGGRLVRPYRPLKHTIAERIGTAAKAITGDDQRVAKHEKKAAKARAEREAAKQRGEDAGPDVKPLRVPARTSRIRHAVAGSDHEGLTDTLICSQCRKVYKAAEYGLLLRTRANSTQGWVTVRVAAETLRRPEQTVWRWIRELEVPAACSAATRRVQVEWEAIKALSDEKARRDHDRQERRNARTEQADVEEAS